ncbi:hypothetical protein J4573_45200, partial [Actinomadura barringtoniae]
KTPMGPSQPTGITLPAGKFYSYAPSTVEEGNTRHVFYCGNTVSGVFHDNVMVSVGTKTNGTWAYTTPRVAFGPSQSVGWANYHTCDPEVLRGAFTWNGHTYPWAIFFTAFGCATQDSACAGTDKASPNQLGVAFSDSLDASPSDWKIYPTPLISYDSEFGGRCATSDYCVGQPSATSINGAGQFLLFYQGKGGFVRRQVDLSDATKPVIGDPLVLKQDGLPSYLHNASLVYSTEQKRFYMSYNSGAWNVVKNGPPVQTDTVIASCDNDLVWKGDGVWKTEDTISGAHSTHVFNHNSGIVRNPYGMAVSTSLDVIHTVADTHYSDGTFGEWTYRLWTNTYTPEATAQVRTR